MADTKVSKEVSIVAAVEEKCRFDMSSYEDLTEPDCSETNHNHYQASDPDNSYSFVSGSDDLSDNAVGNKDVSVEGSTVVPEPVAAAEDQGAKLDAQDVKLDVASGEHCEPLSGGENEDGTQATAADSVDEHSVIAESRVEAEIRLGEDPKEKTEISGEAAVEMVGEQKGISEILVEAETNQLQDLGGKTDGSEGDVIVVRDQVEKIEGLEKTEQKDAEDLVISESAPGHVENQESEAGSLQLVEEPRDNGGEVEINLSATGTSKPCQSSYQRSHDTPVDAVEGELRDVGAEVEDEMKLAREVVEGVELEVSVATSSGLGNEAYANGETETPAENERDMVKDQNEKVEAVAVAVAVAKEEQEDVVDLMKSDSLPGPVENQESEAGSLQSVEESRDNGAEVEINLSATGTSELCQSSHDMPVDAVECEMQDERAEVEGEVKPAREVVKGVELEVPVATSSGSNNESYANGETETSAENERERVEDESEKVEAVAVAKDEQEDAEDLMKSDSSPGPAENQESQVAALELEAESRETGDGNVSSHNDEFGFSNGDSADQMNLSTTSTSEACQTSRHTSGDVVEHELQDVRVDRKDEVELAGEVVERVEPEVPQETSLDLDQGSYPNGTGEISGQDETKMVEDDGKTEGLVKVEQEKDKNLAKSNSSLGSVESQESQVGDLVLLSESTENEKLSAISSHIDKPEDSKDEHEDQIYSSTIESQDVDIGESRQQDVSINGENEVELAREVMVNDEVPQTTSLDLAQESMGINDEEDTLEKEAKESCVIDQETCNTDLGENVQHVSEDIDETHTAVSCSDLHAEIVCDSSVSHIDDGIQYPEVPEKHPDASGIPQETMQSENKSEAPVLDSNAHETQTDVRIPNAESIEAVSSSPIDGSESQIIDDGITVDESLISCTAKEASSGSGILLDGVVCVDNESTIEGGEVVAETEVSSGKVKVANSPPATYDVKADAEAYDQNFPAISSVQTNNVLTVASSAEVSFKRKVNNEREATQDSGDQWECPARSSNDDSQNVSNREISVSFKADNEPEAIHDNGDQLEGPALSSNGDLLLQEDKHTGNSHNKNIAVVSPDSSTANMMNGAEELSIKTKTKPFNLLIRIPRFDDESLREQIMLAKLHIDEKTKLRDAIKVQMQQIRKSNNQVNGVDYEYAISEGRSARKLVKSKRMEIESLLSVLNKAKNALSVEDINNQISNMERMIQHDTLPLKEEKMLIREMKQLKQLREQLSSSMGSQEEIKQAIEQKEEMEERLKVLRKELDILKDKVIKAEAAAGQARINYDDEIKRVKELEAQFRTADDVRQAAYVQWQTLRKELSRKNQHFFKYRDDAALASNYAFSRNTEALYSLCTNHVENFMELWNTNEEFRREYANCNTRSTVRRLGTLDGRSLGPDEEPPVLPRYGGVRSKRVVSTSAKVDSVPRIPTPELKQEKTVKTVSSDDQATKEVTEHKIQKLQNKVPAKTVLGNGLDAISDIGNEVNEQPQKSKEETELKKKEEERRRDESEALLKEQRRLEGLEKAKEARERKRRQAEKLQLRAELKIQKEAEQREKEREKRLRKKERRKAAATDANDGINNHDNAPSSEEIGKDVEVQETSSAITRKPQKPLTYSKQSKSKSVPPPLRNRNKKKWQQWMWVAFTSLIICVLFWLGNMGVFLNVNLKRRSPLY